MKWPIGVLTALIRILEHAEEYEGSVRKFDIIADIIGLTIGLNGIDVWHL